MRRLNCIFAIVLLQSCGGGDNASAPGGVTAGEAKALDEAAEMVEAGKLPPEGLPPATAAPSADGGEGKP